MSALSAARSVKKNTSIEQEKLKWGYIFIAPAILGILLLNVYPIVYSFITSLNEWDVITPMKFVGFGNYSRLFSDELVGQALSVTLRFTLMSVPLSNIVALLIAILLNQNVKCRSVFRTICYIPSIVPAVASAALWMYIFNPMYGAANELLKIVGLKKLNWIYDKNLVLPCMAIMSAWGSGNTAIIYLAGLQGIPRHLYEAVEIDGGSSFTKFRSVTLPMLSPVILYNLIIGVIGTMQSFTQGYVMTQGGPQNASLFYVLLLYQRAFKNMQMGYACSMAWVLFVIISILTIINFALSKKWVYMEGDL